MWGYTFGTVTILGAFITLITWVNGRQTRKVLIEEGRLTRELIESGNRRTQEMMEEGNRRTQEMIFELGKLIKGVAEEGDKG